MLKCWVRSGVGVGVPSRKKQTCANIVDFEYAAKRILSRKNRLLYSWKRALHEFGNMWHICQNFSRQRAAARGTRSASRNAGPTGRVAGNSIFCIRNRLNWGMFFEFPGLQNEDPFDSFSSSWALHDLRLSGTLWFLEVKSSAAPRRPEQRLSYSSSDALQMKVEILEQVFQLWQRMRRRNLHTHTHTKSSLPSVTDHEIQIQKKRV